MPKKKSKIRTFTKSQHPCHRWCGGRLAGIVENLKLRGEIPPEFEFDIRSAIGLVYVPAGALEMTCQHGRSYILAPKS
jgi:hypothetical protein